MAHRLIALVVASACMAAAAGSASAQCSVYRLGVPDFDQRRDPAPGITGLPGNGNCYCVPTSVMNWLAFVSNHGFPNMLNGPRNWQSNTHYEDVTDFLALMGLIMNTGDGVDPNGCGTNASGFTTGATAWVETFYPGEFVVFAIGPNGTDTLTPQEMYAMEAFGGLVAMCYSRWTVFPPNVPVQGLPQRLVRQPVGHCVTMTRVTDACGPNPRLWYRDPAGFDGPDTNQSQFVTQRSDMVPFPFFYAGNAAAFPIFRTMWRFADLSSNISMLDSAWVITPIHGLSAQPQIGEVSLVGMWNFDLTFPAPTVQPIQGATGVHSVKLSTMPGQGCAVIDTRAGAQLVLLQFESPTAPPQTTMLRSLTDRPGPMAFDRNGRLWLADGNQILKLDLSTRPPTVMHALTVAELPVDLSHDDRTGGMVALFEGPGPGGSIGMIDPAGGMAVHPVMDARVDPDASIAAGRRSEGFFLAAPMADMLWRATFDPDNGWYVAAPLVTIALQDPRNLQCTHQDQLMFTMGAPGGPQTVMALEFDAATGQWAPDTDNALLGEQVGALFSVATSRQYDDDLFDIDTQENIPDLPDEAPGIPDCVADMDADGVVAVPDIFAFLSLWFAGDPFADINLDDLVNVQDIFLFLSLWFAGCP